MFYIGTIAREECAFGFLRFLRLVIKRVSVGAFFVNRIKAVEQVRA